MQPKGIWTLIQYNYYSIFLTFSEIAKRKKPHVHLFAIDICLLKKLRLSVTKLDAKPVMTEKYLTAKEQVRKIFQTNGLKTFASSKKLPCRSLSLIWNIQEVWG